MIYHLYFLRYTQIYSFVVLSLCILTFNFFKYTFVGHFCDITKYIWQFILVYILLLRSIYNTK